LERERLVGITDQGRLWECSKSNEQLYDVKFYMRDNENYRKSVLSIGYYYVYLLLKKDKEEKRTTRILSITNGLIEDDLIQLLKD